MNASFALRGTLTRLADQIAESEKISATFRKTGNKICHFRKKLKFDLPLWLFLAKNICHTRPGAPKSRSLTALHFIPIYGIFRCTDANQER
ncbi:MAG: hypothetical protein ACI4IA_05145 [Acutalibacteraceae bacterium]